MLVDLSIDEVEVLIESAAVYADDRRHMAEYRESARVERDKALRVQEKLTQRLLREATDDDSKRPRSAE
jgi:hypothetical protein